MLSRSRLIHFVNAEEPVPVALHVNPGSVTLRANPLIVPPGQPGNFTSVSAPAAGRYFVDADWADVILTASCPNSPTEMEAYLKALKPGASTVAIRDNPPDRIASARAQGRQAVETAIKLKS